MLLLRHYTLFLLFFVFVADAFAQNNVFQLEVKDLVTNDKISFVHLTVNDTAHVFTDMDGKVSLPYIPESILFTHFCYKPLHLKVGPTTNLALLEPDNNCWDFHKSDKFSEDLIRKVLANKKNYKTSRKKYTCKSYNKFSVTAEKEGKSVKLLEDLLKILSYNFDNPDSTHLFLMESVSEIQHRDLVRKKETIVGMRTTGIKLPSTYTAYVHPNPFTLYENYISISNTKYISPLCHLSYLTYAFKITDSIITEKDNIYCLAFYPLPAKSLNAIKGMLYIDANTNALKYFIGTPVKPGKIKIEAVQEYRQTNGIWFPSSYRTDIVVHKFGSGNVKLVLSAKSFLFDVKSGVRLKPKEFSEIILEYDSLSTYMPEDLWEQYRQEDLSSKDLYTFRYFDSSQVQKKQEEILKFGERIYFGEIPFGPVNLNLNKIIYTNYLEGLRLGLGFHSNKKFSKNWILGTYFGYGLKDKKWKYGADVSYAFNNKAQTILSIGARKDVYEAGAQYFPFDMYQYSAEPLRKYRLEILDYINQSSSEVSFRPLKYLQVNGGLRISEHFTSYSYQYRGEEKPKLDFTELNAGFRYAFGEEYIKTPENTVFLGSRFPILWFNFTKGIKDPVWGEYKYNRFDIKIQQTFNFFRFGLSGLQIVAGITNGNAPYTKLYNMRGSLRELSVVIHNSFETMQYNEFLSDRFIALFYSHDFGQLYIPHPNFRPNLVMVHNFGFGTLKHPERHEMISFKTMEKGYFESGVFLKNLLVFNFSGLRTGFGCGLFYRYGHYEYDRLRDNMVFKLSANFLL